MPADGDACHVAADFDGADDVLVVRVELVDDARRRLAEAPRVYPGRGDVAEGDDGAGEVEECEVSRARHRICHSFDLSSDHRSAGQGGCLCVALGVGQFSRREAVGEGRWRSAASGSRRYPR